jgi:hypothetical protein
MDVLIPDWSEHDADKGYEVHASLVSSAKVGQTMSTVLDVANRHGSGSRPAQQRYARRGRGPRPAIR